MRFLTIIVTAVLGLSGIVTAAPTPILDEHIEVFNSTDSISKRHHCQPAKLLWGDPNPECNRGKSACAVVDWTRKRDPNWNPMDRQNLWPAPADDPWMCEKILAPVKGIDNNGRCRCMLFHGDSCQDKAAIDVSARVDMTLSAEPAILSYRCWTK